MEDTKENIQIASLGVQGMTCASCVRIVERAIQKVPGIETVQVSLGTESAQFSFNSSLARVSDIKKAIEKAGYVPKEGEDRNALDARKEKELKSLKRDFIIALLGTVPLFYLAMAPMISKMFFSGLGLLPAFLMPHYNPVFYGFLSAALALPALWGGRRFFQHGIPSLIHLQPTMDSLVAVGSGAAILYSALSLIRLLNGDSSGLDHLYFETAAVVLTLVLLGKLLESSAKRKTSSSIQALLRLSPAKACLVTGDGTEREIDAKDLLSGDLIRIRSGEHVPADGVVFEGSSSVDESMLTGESLPVEKSPGSELNTGTLNLYGSLLLRVNRVGSETTLARIIRLVENAQASKAPIARLADTVSAWFVPIVMGIAVLSAVIWFLNGSSFDTAFSIFTAVLLVACPCALGLATPMAIMTGSGKGAEQGLLFRNAEALEQMTKITSIIFDKTGTVTLGVPRLCAFLFTGSFEESEVLFYTAIAEQNAEHPLAKAYMRYWHEKDSLKKLPNPDQFIVEPGFGVRAEYENTKILLGKESFLQSFGVDFSGQENFMEKCQNEAKKGRSLLFVAINNKLAGCFAAEDEIRPEAEGLIKELKRLGLKTILLSGDRAQAVEAVGRQLGVDEIFAEVLPGEKAQKVLDVQHDHGLCAMVGDGINDAPALASADLGIALGNGSDAAIENAGLVLSQANLKGILYALQLSKGTVRNIKQNLFWAFAYNIVLIPIATGLLSLLGGPLMNPMFAALAMSLSSVSVVSNALRLRRFKFQELA